MGREVLFDERLRDQFYEYLHSSPHDPVDDAFRDNAAAMVAGLTRETVAAVGARVRENFTCEAGATDGSTNARSALDPRRGVCQDFVHVAPVLLRTAGIPARYASGYVHPDADAAVDAAVTGQSHAQPEAWTGPGSERCDEGSGAPATGAREVSAYAARS